MTVEKAALLDEVAGVILACDESQDPRGYFKTLTYELLAFFREARMAEGVLVIKRIRTIEPRGVTCGKIRDTVAVTCYDLIVGS